MGRALGTLYIVDPGQANAKDLAVHEENGVEGLVLSRCRDFAAHCKVAEECAQCFRAQLVGRTSAMEEDVPPDPLQVGLLGADAVVLDSNGLAHPIEEAARRGG